MIRCGFLGLITAIFLHFPTTADPIDYAHIDARLKRLMASENMVGLSVAIIENGETSFLRGYGKTHRDGMPVDADTVFRWASLSKSVAASVIGQMADEGTLKLTDPASHFKTSLRLPQNGEKRATLIDLLAHRLGIVSNAYDGRLEDLRTPASIRTSLAKLKYVCPLGTCHSYQNVAFDTVSEIVEDVEAISYQDSVAKRIFDPLDMASASIDREGLSKTGNFARPHTARRGSRTPIPAIVNDAYYNVPAAGGVNGSVRDLAKYMHAQMGLRPDILAPEVLSTIQTPHIPTIRETRSLKRRFGRISNSQYALGWRVYDYAGHRVIGHRGAVKGYRALILFDPEQNSGIAALWNSASSQPVGLQFEFMDMIYGLPRHDWLKLGFDVPTASQQSAP